MNELFYNCSSKWNTENVKNMSGVLYGCSSLTKLPDISKWNTKIL